MKKPFLRSAWTNSKPLLFVFASRLSTISSISKILWSFKAEITNTSRLPEVDLAGKTKGSKGVLSEEASSYSFDSFAALDPSFRP